MGLGDSLRQWAKSKAEELVTADGDERSDAAASASAASSQAKSDLGETLLRAAFPKLGELADQQTAARASREAAEVAEREAEIASLPLAAVQLSLSGHVTASWSGSLHHSWTSISPHEPDASDPYADRPLVWFELFAAAGAEPDLGGLRLSHWSFQLPGWHGDGVYDLTAIARSRESAGAALDHLEWAMDFADTSFCFHPGAPQSSVSVSDSGRTLSAAISMTGELGDLTATATISR